MNSFKDRKNISIANLKSIVGETTQARCVAESVLENKPVDKLPEQEHAIKDKAGELYSVRFQRSEDLWDIKLLHDGRKIGETNCLRQGENLLLGNIEIFSTAAPPGVMAGGTSPHPTMPNYRGRGAGAALLQFIIEQARLSGLQQITGNLLPQNLQDKRDLPDWYRRRGFTVRMNQGGPGVTISLDLTRVKGQARNSELHLSY
jgi:GNAT superfamily N-acetyltransferase